MQKIELECPKELTPKKFAKQELHHLRDEGKLTEELVFVKVNKVNRVWKKDANTAYYYFLNGKRFLLASSTDGMSDLYEEGDFFDLLWWAKEKHKDTKRCIDRHEKRDHRKDIMIPVWETEETNREHGEYLQRCLRRDEERLIKVIEIIELFTGKPLYEIRRERHIDRHSEYLFGEYLHCRDINGNYIYQTLREGNSLFDDVEEEKTEAKKHDKTIAIDPKQSSLWDAQWRNQE